MKVLVVGLVKNNQLKRLQKEGKKRGHVVDGCYASDLIIYSDNHEFSPILKGKDLKSYDLIYFWAVGKRRWEWYVAALYLSKNSKKVIVNKKVVDSDYKMYLTSAIDYLRQYENNLPFPKSAIIFSKNSIEEVIERFNFPLIVKPSEGRQGKDVNLVNSRKELIQIVDNLLKDVPSVVIREFIPNDGDIRIFTIGYKAIAAMKRIPKKGDFRSNISQGGKGEIYEIYKYPDIKYMSEYLSELTRTEIAGVDIIINKETGKPYILEINPGPQFTGMEYYTKKNIALEIIKYFEKLTKKTKI